MMRMRILMVAVAALAGVALGVFEAGAILPPAVYKAARENAPYHIQIKITHVDRQCRIDGTVVRVFRARGEPLKAGDKVRFQVDCLKPGDDPPVGPVFWQHWDVLIKARFMEAYLDGTPDSLAPARWQTWVIDKPTDAPTE